MKLIASGVMNSAATTRSPSFSRSSSSTRITIRPALSSAMISRVEARVMLAVKFGKARILRHAARQVARPNGICHPDDWWDANRKARLLRCVEHPLDIPRDQVDLEIHLRAFLQGIERSDFHRMRNQIDRKLAAVVAVVDRVDGQAHA